MEHEITLYESGNWQRTIKAEDGELKEGEAQNIETELLVEAECTCGDEFINEDEAYEHIRNNSSN